jgi:hypothetical protein
VEALKKRVADLELDLAMCQAEKEEAQKSGVSMDDLKEATAQWHYYEEAYEEELGYEEEFEKECEEYAKECEEYEKAARAEYEAQEEAEYEAEEEDEEEAEEEDEEEAEAEDEEETEDEEEEKYEEDPFSDPEVAPYRPRRRYTPDVPSFIRNRRSAAENEENEESRVPPHLRNRRGEETEDIGETEGIGDYFYDDDDSGDGYTDDSYDDYDDEPKSAFERFEEVCDSIVSVFKRYGWLVFLFGAVMMMFVIFGGEEPEDPSAYISDPARVSEVIYVELGQSVTFTVQAD